MRNPKNPDPKVRAAMAMTLEQRRERYESILREVAAGGSYKTVGQRWNISAERVRQIVHGGLPGPAGTLGHYYKRRRQ